MKTHLVLKSSNGKTGPIPVSTSSAETCPTACPFRSKGCYAKGGPLALHWKQVTSGNRGLEWEDFCSTIAKLPNGQLWRHNQAGDLPGVGNRIDAKKLSKLVESNRGKNGFTYTHKPITAANIKAVRQANENGFTINLSANSIRHADKLAETGLPVVCVLPSDANQNVITPNGRKVTVCPATQKENVSCATCKLCANGSRSVIIGFPAHGMGKKAVDSIASM